MKIDFYGWFPKTNKKTLDFLIKKHKIKTVIEIGCFLGKSTSFFASRGCHIHSIDTFKGSEDINKSSEVVNRLPVMLEQFLFNIEATGISDRVNVYRGTSEEIAKMYPNLVADMVFIDGSHVYEDVKNDINLWKDRGIKIICGDDFTEVHPGVVKAVNELLPEANKDQRCWYYIKKYEKK